MAQTVPGHVPHRLLRQDAITSAAGTARDIVNREKDTIRAFGLGPDLDALAAELAEEQATAAEYDAAVADTKTALRDIESALAGSHDVAVRWQDAQIAVAEARAGAAAADQEVARTAAELAAVRIPPEVPGASLSPADLAEALSAVNVELSRATAAQERAAHAAATERELGKVTTALDKVLDQINDEGPAQAAMEQSRLGTVLANTEAVRDTAVAARDELRNAHAEIKGSRTEVARRAGAAATLGAVCGMCEQPISATHRHDQEKALQLTLTELDGRLAELQTRGEAQAVVVADAEAAVIAARRAHTAASARLVELKSLCGTRNDLITRRGTYVATLSRVVVETFDMPALQAESGRLAAELALARQHDEVMRARTAGLDRAKALQVSLEAARARAVTAHEVLTAAAPDPGLEVAHTERATLLTRRDDELELLSAVVASAAGAKERVASVLRAQSSAAELAERAAKHRRDAEVAARAAELLRLTATQMAALVRPQLEGELSMRLQQLSEGRFTTARVSEDYEITVLDDDKFRALSEFSGGESVLIALATRLALASVVSGRAGGESLNFLVLDEVFGAQDAGRRDAILAGLRTLRATYGQILLISHVGGVEEAADRVLHLELAEEDEQVVSRVIG